MLKKRACKHCVGLFQPVRTGHFYCSDTCRKLAFKAKNKAKAQAKRNKKLSEKLKKLANSAFGIYLIKELKRAKTVEILKGHDSETLTALAKLRRQCTAAGGYEDGDSLGYYELSHIYPVSGKERLGLLNLSNLAITPKKFNRKHGTKLPLKGYMGASIPRASLLKQWKIQDSLDGLETLKLARKYIGEEFDIWLKKHLISQTQKSAILKKLKEAGFDYDVVKTMGLKELKSIAEEKDIPYFSITKEPKSLIDITLRELERLKLQSELFHVIKKTYELDSCLDPSDHQFNGSNNELDTFKEFICEQALLCIHGQTFKEEWKGKSLDSYFYEKPRTQTQNIFFREMNNEEDEYL